MVGKRNSRGFTLMEIAMVVALLAVILAMAVPMYRQYLESAQNASLVSNFRVFSQAFQHYATETGSWPPDQPRSATYPAGMQEYLEDTGWEDTSAIGGNFYFDSLRVHRGIPWPAVISLGNYETGSPEPVRASLDQIAEIDESLDDGDLDSGDFRRGYQNMPILILDGTYETYVDMAANLEANDASPPTW
jgi:prepilin-type N-terminal cleavage/methylation domain-containing protein